MGEQDRSIHPFRWSCRSRTLPSQCKGTTRLIFVQKKLMSMEKEAIKLNKWLRGNVCAMTGSTEQNGDGTIMILVSSAEDFTVYVVVETIMLP